MQTTKQLVQKRLQAKSRLRTNTSKPTYGSYYVSKSDYKQLMLLKLRLTTALSDLNDVLDRIVFERG